MQDNPYAASAASIADERMSNPSAGPGELVYAGFWRRFGAYWIDVAIFLPLGWLTYVLGEMSRLFHAYWFVPSLLIGLAFHVYLVKRYGGTPGKLILKMRIAMVDGASVTTRAAFLRYSVLFLLTALSSLAMVKGALAMGDAYYLSLSYMEKVRVIVARAPAWYPIVTLLIQVWVLGEFVTMMFNHRRRAVHDYMAGTVVVVRT